MQKLPTIASAVARYFDLQLDDFEVDMAGGQNISSFCILNLPETMYA